MSLHRLVARERAFHQKEINATRERCERVRVACVRSIDQRRAVRFGQTNRKTLARVRSRKSFSAKMRQNLKLCARRDLSYLNRERLLQQFVIVGFVERPEEFLQSAPAENV